MRKSITAIILIIVGFVLITVSESAAGWADRWTVNGIKVSDITSAKSKDVPMIAAGIASSFIAHQVSHVAAASTFGKSMRFSSYNTEVWAGEYTDQETNIIDMAGFVGQLSLGSMLNHFDSNKYFMLGYDYQAVQQIMTYPNGEGDFKNSIIDPDLERAVLINWANMNLSE